MAKMIFVNLPVADVAKSTAFYEALGMTKDPRFSNEQASSMQWSDEIVFMLLDKPFFQTFTPLPMADPKNSIQVLISLTMDGRAELDALVDKAVAAGGTADASPPQDLGFMYSRDFADPDGNGFGLVYMDMAKAQEMFGDAGPASAG